MIRVKDLFVRGGSYLDFVQIEPTTRCNFNCLTCVHSQLDKRRRNLDLSTEQFRHILSCLPRVRLIRLQGLGEPFLHPNLEDLLKVAQERNVKLSTITNGSMNVVRLLPYFEEVVYSINAISKELHHKLSGANFYSEVMDNLFKASEKLPHLDHTKIWLSFVASHLNIHELDAFVDLCRELHFGCSVVAVENWRGNGDKDFFAEARRITDKIDESVKRAHNLGLRVNYLRYSPRAKVCQWPINRCFITSDGYVTPCCIRMDPKYAFGNLFNQSFRQIWSSEKYRIFRRSKGNNMICGACPN